MQGYIYRLKISDIPSRPSVALYPTIEIAPSTPATDAYLTHNPIPVQFTAEDFDQVVDGGNFVTKVIYLPDPKYQELAIAGVETLVSTRLEPGVDPILEADKRGTILMIVRLGAIDLEMPSTGAATVPANAVPGATGVVPNALPGGTMLPPGVLPPGVVTNPAAPNVPLETAPATPAIIPPPPPAVDPATPPPTTPPIPKEEAPTEAAPKPAAPAEEAPKEDAPKVEAPAAAARAAARRGTRAGPCPRRRSIEQSEFWGSSLTRIVSPSPRRMRVWTASAGVFSRTMDRLSLMIDD